MFHFIWVHEIVRFSALGLLSLLSNFHLFAEAVVPLPAAFRFLLEKGSSFQAVLHEPPFVSRAFCKSLCKILLKEQRKVEDLCRLSFPHEESMQMGKWEIGKYPEGSYAQPSGTWTPVVHPAMLL